MSTHVPTHPAERSHPQAREYITIATVLSVITAMEVAVYYMGALRPYFLPPLLIVLSGVKFSLVVMFYMHLRFDHRLFTGMFLFGLATAAFTIVAFLALFGFVALVGV